MSPHFSARKKHYMDTSPTATVSETTETIQFINQSAHM